MSTPPHGSQTSEVRLAPAQLAELVAGGVTIVVPGGPSIRLVPDYAAGIVERRLVDADAVASVIGMSAAWVREHAEDLGGHRMGDGPRPRWRFDLDQVQAAWASRSSGERSPVADPSPAAGFRRRRSPSTGAGVELLPVRDQQGGRRAA